MAQIPLEVIISGTDRFSGTASRVVSGLRNIDASARRVGTGIGQVAGGLTRLGLVAAGAAAGGIVAAAKAAATFEAQLRTINTIAKADTDGLREIGDGLRSLARDGRGDLADLSAAFYDVLSAGITDSTDAFSVLDAASKLAIGGLATNAQAVDVLTTAINAYGQDASMAAADADLFAKAIEIGKVTADEIAASFANVAPIAAQMGIGIEEVAAAYGALTAQGTPASEVTTQMQRAILDLLSPNKELLALQKATGVSFMEMARDDGLVVALQAMRDAVNGDEQAFKDLFGRVEGYKFALQTTGAQQGIYNSALDAMGESAGTAAAQMGERRQGLAFAFGRLKANVTDALISVGEGFTPALARMADRLSSFLDENRDNLMSLGKDIGAAFDAIDFDALLRSVKDIAAAFRDNVLPVLATGLALFRALPGPVQGLGAALAVGANSPLIGGAISSIGKGIGNIAVGALGMVTSTVGKGIGGAAGGLLGRAFAQPVFVTNWPMGGMGGGAGGMAGGAKGLFMSFLPLAVAAAMTAATAYVVGGVQGQMADRTSRQATNLRRTTTRSLQGTHTRADLDTKLAAIETGIAQIESNPLLGLVGGGAALEELRAMRREVVAKIAETNNSSHNAYIAQQTAARTANDTFNRVYDAVERNRIAIASMPPPQVTVNVSVTGRSVTTAQTEVARAGTLTRLQTTNAYGAAPS